MPIVPLLRKEQSKIARKHIEESPASPFFEAEKTFLARFVQAIAGTGFGLLFTLFWSSIVLLRPYNFVRVLVGLPIDPNSVLTKEPIYLIFAGIVIGLSSAAMGAIIHFVSVGDLPNTELLYFVCAAYRQEKGDETQSPQKSEFYELSEEEAVAWLKKMCLRETGSIPA